jgi:DNA-binding beta-propeller fold protein YncE
VVVVFVALAGRLGRTVSLEAAPAAPVVLPGHVLRALAASTDLGPVPVTQPITLTVALKPADAAGLRTAASAASRAARSDRAARPAADIGSLYGQPSATIHSVGAYFAGFGLRIAPPPPDHLSFRVSGTVGQVQQSLGVQLHRYQDAQGRRFYATIRDPQLPATFAGVVQAIFGLDNYPALQRHVAAAAPTPGQYTPAEIQTAYNVSPLLAQGSDGTGQTIGVIDCDTFLASDVQTFRSTYGLPSATISTVAVDGGANGASPESTLDLEWTGAMAPGAALRFYGFASVAGGCPFQGLLDALTTAVNDNVADVLSISLGACELTYNSAIDPTGQSYLQAMENEFAAAAAEQIGVVVASGDLGAYTCNSGQSNANPTVSYPASSEYVTAVGGTTLTLSSTSAYLSETAWSSSTTCGVPCGSGGGYSQVLAEPSWQSQAGITDTVQMRAVPDVALNADPTTGYLIYYTLNNELGCTGTCVGIGGTNVAAPAWAGIDAVANQLAGRRLGSLNPLLYNSVIQSSQNSTAPNFHDVTSGNNLLYSAGPGWDPATGWGSPNASNLVHALVDAINLDTPTPSPTLTPSLSVTNTGTPTFTATPSGTSTATSSGGSSATATASVSTTPATTPSMSATPTPSTTVTSSTIYAYLRQWGMVSGDVLGPGGVALDASGDVYVVDADNHRVEKFDSSGNYLAQWGTGGSGAGEFLFAQGGGSFSGIAVDSQSYVYVADTGNNRIQKFTSSGSFVLQWGSLGTAYGQFQSPWGIAADSSGNVYVADSGNARVQKFTSAGVYLTEWGLPGGSGAEIQRNVAYPPGGCCSPSGIAVDNSGDVFVINGSTFSIQKFTSSGLYQAQWGSQGTNNGQFEGPWAIAVDQSGSVYVVDAENGGFQRVEKFDSAGTYLGQWGSPGTGPGQFNWAQGIGLDSSGNAYVADWGNNRIEKFDSTGRFLTQWGQPGRGQLIAPAGVAIDSAGNVYVSDNGNNRVQKFTSTGTYLTQWGSAGSGAGQLLSPSGLAVDSTGDVYVADFGNGRIEKFDSSGNYLTQFSSTGLSQRLVPQGVAVGPQGNVYVADSGNNQIVVFGPTGEQVAVIGSAGSGPAQFNNPQGIAIDSAGNVYVADTNNFRIVKLTATGTYLTQWGVPGSGDGQFSYPNGVAVDSAGNVYVADYGNGRNQKFTSSGDYLTQWGSWGFDDGQFYWPQGIFVSGVAVDQAGNVYDADSGNNRVQVFAPFSATMTATPTSTPGCVDPATSTATQTSTYTSALLTSSPTPTSTGTPVESVQGYVRDAITCNSLAGAQVSVGGIGSSVSTTTDSSGFYSLFWGNEGFASSITASLAGYVSQTIQGFVYGHSLGQPITESFALLPLTSPSPTRSETPTITPDNTLMASFTATASPTLTPTVTFTVAPIATSVQIPAGSTAVVQVVSNNGQVSLSIPANFLGQASQDQSVQVNVVPTTLPNGATQVNGATPLFVVQVALSDNGQSAAGTAFVEPLTISMTYDPAEVAALGLNESSLQIYLVNAQGNVTALASVVDSEAHTVTAQVPHLTDIALAGSSNASTTTATPSSSAVATGTATATVTPSTTQTAMASVTLTGSPSITSTPTCVSAGYTLTTLVPSLVNSPGGVAVDDSGNVYIADGGNHAVKEWVKATGTLTTLVTGISSPAGVAVDSSGNVYFADTNNAIKEWVMSTRIVTTLVSSGLARPLGVAVDDSGNVYIADSGDYAIKEWVKSSGIVTTLVSSGLDDPWSVAVDSSGNVYFADTGNNAIKEWVKSSRSVTTLSSWLSQPTGVAVDSSGNVYIAGVGIIAEWVEATGTVTQLVANGLGAPLGVAVDSSGNVYIADTYNSAIREWVRASGTVTTLVPTGLTAPEGVTVDSGGNVYIANSGHDAINEWDRSTGTTSLVLSGLNGPSGVAVDESGNVYIADTFNNAIKEWVKSSGSVITLVSSGLNDPFGVAVDSSGNVYIADGNNQAIKEWLKNSGIVTTLVSGGLNDPEGVAVDSSGNVYIADSGNDAIKEWVKSSGAVITLVSGGLSDPDSVAVDNSGNVYIADTGNNAIKEWVMKTGTVTTMVSSGLNNPNGVAVDSSGNVYIADTDNQAIEEASPLCTTPTNNVQLSLLPSTAALGIGQVLTTTIQLSTGAQPVDGVAAFLNFDPSIFQVVDAASNPATSIANPGSPFDQQIQNSVDNSTGQINYSVGTLNQPRPSGTITVGTIYLKAIKPSTGSNVTFAFDQANNRVTDVEYQFTPLLNQSQAFGATYSVVNTASLAGSVTLQGRASPIPAPAYAEPLDVRFYQAGTSTLVFEATPTIDQSGSFVIGSIPSGSYDIWVKNAHSLANLVPAISLGPGTTPLSLGTLLEGDTDGDNQISLHDFSLLTATYGTQSGQAGYNPNADLDNSGQVNFHDFSLLATNFGLIGAQPSGGSSATRSAVAAPSGNVGLQLMPTLLTGAVGSTADVTIQVTAGSQAVDAVAAYVDFDPTVLQVVDANGQPTTAIQAASGPLDVVIQNVVDNAHGRIGFAAGVLSSARPSGTFTLGTIHFKVIGALPADGSAIQLVTDRTNNRASDVERAGAYLLGATQNASIAALGAPITVQANLSGDLVTVGIPSGSPGSALIGQLSVEAPSSAPAITPAASAYQPLLAVDIDAADPSANPLHTLSEPITVSVTFARPASQNPLLARIYEVESGGAVALPTTIHDNQDGTFTALAHTPHLSQFELFAPTSGSPVPQVFVPMVPQEAGLGFGW